MILTETVPTNLFANRLAQIHQETERLSAITTQLKTKQQKLTQLFNQSSSALNVVSQLTALFPQTSTEIRATLEAIFQQNKPENCSVSEVKPQTPSHPLIQVAYQFRLS
jgi:peptidoglycan hydrolase CwlO-like protein